MLDAQHVRHGQVRVLALDLVGGARPADELPPEACWHQAHDVGWRLGPDGIGQTRAQQHQAGDLAPLRQLECQQAAQAVADDHRGATQGVEAGDRVVDIRVQVEHLEVGRVRPEMSPQVEGVPLPAALREVLEVALPDPRATQLAVEQVQRSATGAALRQPALDVQPALLDDDLVLAHRSAGRP